MTAETGSPILEVRNLRKMYQHPRTTRLQKYPPIQAVRGVSFALQPGETLGLVGESGCGKSSLANATLMLDPPTSGDIYFEGRNLVGMAPRELRAVRRRLQVIFQDPYSSLNARMTVEDIVGEPLIAHRLAASRAQRRAMVYEVLDKVGLSTRDAARHPHEFSGGQRQRIGIARALISRPSVVVCDEAVSALDVSIQAQVLNLLKDLQREFQLSYLFISHDLSTVGQIVDRVAVMYLGSIVEAGQVREVFETPAHPYTRALLDAIPRRDQPATAMLAGEVPSPSNPPSGCSFHPRCTQRGDVCGSQAPELSRQQSRDVACHFPLETRVAGAV